jgi:hypothetical protein
MMRAIMPIRTTYTIVSSTLVLTQPRALANFIQRDLRERNNCFMGACYFKRDNNVWKSLFCGSSCEAICTFALAVAYSPFLP